MPSKTLKEQRGNSCAAHCTVIAVADLLDVQYLLSESYAEETLWPAIQFQTTGVNPAIDALAAEKNSDPRRIVSEAELRWAALKATLKCDDTQESRAMSFISDLTTRLGLDGLFNLLKGSGTAGTIAPADGVYLNATYLMIRGSKASGGTFEGMHNILVTRQAGSNYYYNPNESTPAWNTTFNWKQLEGQNRGNYSYVFTGVCVEMKRK